MRIALASARVRNNDMAFNLSQMRKYMAQAREQNADLVCFGEAFLQGFDALFCGFVPLCRCGVVYKA